MNESTADYLNLNKSEKVSFFQVYSFELCQYLCF